MRFEGSLGRLDQALAKPPRRRLGSIASTLDRLVGSIALAAPITITFPSRSRGALRAEGGPAAFRRAADRAGPAAVRALGDRRGHVRDAGRLAVPVPVARAAVRLALRAFGSIEVLRLNIRNMQETVAAHGKIDKGRLDGRLEVDDPALVNIAV